MHNTSLMICLVDDHFCFASALTPDGFYLFTLLIKREKKKDLTGILHHPNLFHLVRIVFFF